MLSNNVLHFNWKNICRKVNRCLLCQVWISLKMVYITTFSKYNTLERNDTLTINRAEHAHPSDHFFGCHYIVIIYLFILCIIVSEHVAHSKAIQIFHEKNRGSLLLFCMASLMNICVCWYRDGWPPKLAFFFFQMVLTHVGETTQHVPTPACECDFQHLSKTCLFKNYTMLNSIQCMQDYFPNVTGALVSFGTLWRTSRFLNIMSSVNIQSEYFWGFRNKHCFLCLMVYNHMFVWLLSPKCVALLSLTTQPFLNPWSLIPIGHVRCYFRTTPNADHKTDNIVGSMFKWVEWKVLISRKNWHGF
jgi:hypothetical protein